MKKLLLFTQLMLSLVAIAQIPTNGLIVHYPMGQSFANGQSQRDISGNNLHLIAGIGSFDTNRNGLPNEAASFSHTNDQRRIDYNSNLTVFHDNTNFTISAWVRLTTPYAGEYQSIVQLGDNNIFLRFRKTTTNIYSLQGGHRTGSTTFAIAESGINFNNFANTWVHVMLVRQSGNLQMFVNNVSVATGTSSTIVYNTTHNFFTVGSAGNIANQFKGRIQDVLFYNRVLTANEANAIYNHCTSGYENTTSAANSKVCHGASTTLTVNRSRGVAWYASATGGSSLGADSVYTTGNLTTNPTVFYVQVGSCLQRIPIAVEVRSNAIPAIPTIVSDTSAIYCDDLRVRLSLADTQNDVRWYNLPSGGSQIGTGNTYTTPILSNTAGAGQTSIVNFYAEGYNSCASTPNSSRITIPVKLGTKDYTYSVSGYNLLDSIVCYNTRKSIALNSSHPVQFQWYYKNNLRASGGLFTTPFMLGDTTYEAKISKTGSCISILPFPFKVYQKDLAAPTNLTSVSGAVCPNDTITLKASSPKKSPLIWTAGSNTYIGDSIRIPAIHGGQYSVYSGTGGCVSPTTNVNVSTTLTPRGTISLAGTTISSQNLFETYDLYRNGTKVASSSNTGNINYTNASCGDYYAVFTNTTNTGCPHTNLSFRISKNPTVYSYDCYTFRFDNVGFPGTIQVSVNGGPFGSTTGFDGSNTAFVTNVCGITGNNINVTFRFITALGCTYQHTRTFVNYPSATTASAHSGASSVTASRVGYDTITTCPIRSNIVSVTINPPTNTTSSSQLSVCSGNSTTLSANGTGTLRWFAQATGGAVLGTGTSFTTPAITANGIYYVEAVSGSCTTARTAVNVTIRATPAISMVPSGDTICEGKTSVLTANATGSGLSYVWTESSLTTSSINVTPSTNTKYKVTVTNNSTGCSAVDSVMVRVKATSSTTFNESVCHGRSFVFKGQTLTNSGTYKDTLSNTAGCDSIITLQLTVRPRAEKILNANICTGQTYTFKGQQLNTSGQYFDTLTSVSGCDSFLTLNLSINSFVTGNSAASICQGRTYSFKNRQLTAAGQYTDTFVSAGGCDSIHTLTLSLIASAFGSSNASICQGETYGFNGTQLSTAGQYNDTLVAANGCDSIHTLNLTVNANPTPTIIQNGNQLSTQLYNSYQWRRDNSNLSAANSQNYTVSQSGSYTVVVTNSFNCSATSPAISINTAGIEDNIASEVSIYPNPSFDYIHVSTVNNLEKIEIYDLSGKQVYLAEKLGTIKHRIDITMLPAANYIIEIFTAGGHKTTQRVSKD
jgi:hypothetical protein